MDVAATIAATRESTTTTYDKQSLDFFSQIPWMYNVLTNKTLSLRPLSWQAEPAWQLETFFAETLNTERTIPHFCMFKSDTHSAQDPTLIALIHLGAGVAGHAGISHGGMISTLLDEIMGSLVAASTQGSAYFTVNLNVDFMRPVAVPGAIMIKATVEAREGRKISIVAELTSVPKGAEGGEVEVCARGKALFVKPKGTVGQVRPNVVDGMGKIF